MKKVEATDHKRILLHLLSTIDQFCHEKGIRYFAGYGTLLGAVRHKGFIPWDDDIDLIMLREDYDRFVSLFPKDNQCSEFITNVEIDPSYPYTFSKVSDTRTKMIEYLYRPYEIGVYIDIFPIDKWPCDAVAIERVIWLHKLLKAKTYRISSLRSVVKNVGLIVMRIFTPFKSKRAIINDIQRTVDGARAEADYCGNLVSNVYGVKEKMENKWLSGTLRIQFENMMIDIPSGYDEILKQLYGDYMELPPIEEQKPHHHSDAYWR